MRESKYRAWHKADGKMYDVYGFIHNQWFLHGKQVPVPSYALVIMEYTGIEDKHEVEVFEGDIVDLKLNGAFDRFVVHWRDKGPLGYVLRAHPNNGIGTIDLSTDFSESLMVIGNVFSIQDWNY